MELIINQSIKEPKTINTYELVVTFMQGDADGYEDVVTRFSKDMVERPDFRKELEDFIKSIKGCIQHDSGGRCGFDMSYQLVREYSHVENWAKYCITAMDYIKREVKDDLDDFDNYTDEDFLDDYGVSKNDIKNYINNEIPMCQEILMYNFPHYDGWYDSVKKLNLLFYDEFGDKCPVTIKL